MAGIAHSVLSGNITNDDLSILSEMNEEDDDEGIEPSKDFTEKVIKYVTIDNLIKKKNEELKELKDQKKPCEKFIIEYLEDIDQNEVKITNGQLKRAVTTRQKAITKLLIKTVLVKHGIAEDKIKTILKDIDSRPSSQSVALKRINTRTKKK